MWAMDHVSNSLMSSPEIFPRFWKKFVIFNVQCFYEFLPFLEGFVLALLYRDS